MKTPSFKRICSVLVLIVCLLAGCGSFTFTFTKSGDNTTIEVKKAESGKTGETDYFSVGNGRVVNVDSTLDDGKLQIDFARADVFYETGGPDEVIVGDIKETITVGPGDKQTVRLEPGEYVMQITVIETANGMVKVTVDKE